MKKNHRSILLMVMSLVAGLAGPALGADGTWTKDASGNWSATNNWAGGTIADGADSTGWLTRNYTGPRIITIDTTNRTLGIVNLGDVDNSSACNIAASGGAKLTFDKGGGIAQLNQVSGSFANLISTPIALAVSTEIANASPGLLTISGAITSSVAGARTLSNAGSGSGGVTISGILGNGAGTLEVVQKSGTSLLTLSGTNTFTGGLFVKAGTVNGLTSASAYGAPSSVITLGDTNGSANATLQVGAALTYSNPIAVASGNTGIACISNIANSSVFSGPVTLYDHDLALIAVSHVTLNGGMTGKGNLLLYPGSMYIKLYAPGRLNHAGTISVTGAGVGIPASVQIQGGVGSNVTAIAISVTNAPLIISALPLEVNSNGTTLANNNAGGTAVLTVSGGVSGSGDLVLKNNSAIADGITLSTTAITNTGRIVNSGTGSGNALISAAIGSPVTAITENSASSALNVSGILTVNGGGTTLANNNAGGSARLTVSGGVRGTGNLVLNNNSAITNGITLSTAAITNIGGIVNSGSGSGSTLISAVIGANVTGVVQNSGTSPLILGAANTYSGGTTIDSGTLQVANITGFATGPGAVTINAGGTLMGTGTAGGAVTNNDGGRIAPGIDGTAGGTLVVSNLSWKGGGVFHCEVDDLSDDAAGAGIHYDRLVVSNTLTAVPGGKKLVIRMDSLGQALPFQADRNYSLKVISCGTAANLDPADVTLETNLFLVGGTWSVTNANKSIWVIYRGAPAKNYWIGSGNWSTATNWSLGHAPLAGEAVEFDWNSTANCAANAVSNNLESITLASGYTGTVTFASNAVAGAMHLALSGDLAAREGALAFAGNPAVIGAGSVGDPHGAGYTVTVANVSISAGAAIHADNLGFPAGAGPGRSTNSNWGASYGGRGGAFSLTNTFPIPPCYGSPAGPTALGSGGSAGIGGGGALKLIVSGTATVNGRLSANGALESSNSSRPSGGSIWISSGTLEGSGIVAANGGGVSVSSGNTSCGGGGGRIDISGTINNFAGSFQVRGGVPNGTAVGLAGSILLPQSGGTGLTLNNFVLSTNITFGNSLTFTNPVVIASGGRLTLEANTNENTHTFTSLTIASNGSVMCQGNWAAINAAAGGTSNNLYGMGITLIATTVTVNAGGSLNANGGGFYAGGPGYVVSNAASYGGMAGLGFSSVYGSTYGAISNVTALGSGGQSGFGGGALRLIVSETLTVDGTNSANGAQAVWNFPAGSGGSLWIDCQRLEGSGIISANGGPAANKYAGGGGRVHLAYSSTGSPNPVSSGKVVAYGGLGSPSSREKGAAGTVLLTDRSSGEPVNSLYIANDTVASNAVTLLPTNGDAYAGAPLTLAVDKVFIQEKGILQVPSNRTLAVVSLFSNGVAFAADTNRVLASFVAETNSTLAFVGTNEASVYGSNVFDTLRIEAGPKTVRFEAGRTNIVNRGLVLKQATLLSTSEGVWWFLNCQTNASQDVQGVRVMDGNASGGRTITAGRGSSDLGHNVNWLFPSAGTLMWIR